MRVVVVGAGLAGLAAAWELTRSGADVTIVERESRVGGIILTERRDGFIVEGGPDGWLAAEPEIPALAAELGIGDRQVSQMAKGSSRWTGRALEPLQEGEAAALLGIPVRRGDLSAGFSSFAGGMGDLVDALVARLGPKIRTSLGVTGVRANGPTWQVSVAPGPALEASAVILALPAYAAAPLLIQAGVAAARGLGDAIYQPSSTVSLAYRADQIGRRLEGTGFVANDAGVLRACTYASAKFPGRAPRGHTLLRAFVAPAEDDPAAAAHRELAAILEVRGTPMWSRVFQWSRGIPRPTPEHRALVAEVRDALTRLPPITICGAGYDGAGISACVKSGRAAAGAILEQEPSGRGKRLQ